MKRWMSNESWAMAGASACVLLAVLACKSHKSDDQTAATAATVVAAPTAEVPKVEDAPDTSVPPKPSASTKPKPACKGLMIGKRCARECGTSADCPDPKEVCDNFSGFDDDNQDVQGARVCLYDKNNEPRVTAPSGADTVAPNGDDCPDGWTGPMGDRKCHKPCSTDKDCHRPNVCMADPIGGHYCDIAMAP